jgi:hypothetical protein
MLKIAAEGGASGLATALKNPKIVLPALAGLGVRVSLEDSETAPQPMPSHARGSLGLSPQ